MDLPGVLPPTFAFGIVRTASSARAFRPDWLFRRGHSYGLHSRPLSACKPFASAQRCYIFPSPQPCLLVKLDGSLHTAVIVSLPGVNSVGASSSSPALVDLLFKNLAHNVPYPLQHFYIHSTPRYPLYPMFYPRCHTIIFMAPSLMNCDIPSTSPHSRYMTFCSNGT